jgi:hypothetical protein
MTFVNFVVVVLCILSCSAAPAAAAAADVAIAVSSNRGDESVHEHAATERRKLRLSLPLSEVDERHAHTHGCALDNDGAEDRQCSGDGTSALGALVGDEHGDVHLPHVVRKRYLGDPSASCVASMCDVPDVAKGYLQSLREDRLRDAGVTLRVVTFTTDDGKSPHIDKTATASQSFILNQGFLPVGVYFSVRSENIASTFKWSKQVVADQQAFDRCRFNVGENGKCDKACDSEEFGYDNGECLCPDQAACAATATATCRCLKGDTPGEQATPAYCTGTAKNNGRCDVVCNLPLFDWDHGDCCQANSPFCYDPQYQIDSVQSSFISIAESVNLIPPSDSELTALVMPFALSDQVLGLASLPQRPARTVPHGFLLANSARLAWGQHLNLPKKRFGVTAFHEIMHVFGLLHTHQNYDQSSGFSIKKDICSHACVETHASDTQGDFCSDTPPTPENRVCSDPEPCSQTAKGQWCSDCSSRAWRSTNYANVMGYAPDECIYGAAVRAFSSRGNNSRSTGFQVGVLDPTSNGYLTPLQAARARCYYDMRWSRAWAQQRAPSVVPVAPTVSVGAGGLVGLTIDWMFPVYLGNGSTISFTVERAPAFDVSGGLINLPPFQLSQLPSDAPQIAKAPVDAAQFYTGFKIGEAALNFGHYRDKSAAGGQSYRYRVRAGAAGDVSLAWSAWSEAARADGGDGCPGNCYGHGTCASGTCRCNAGWSKRDPLCRLEDECAGAEGSGCTVSQVGDGICQEACQDCTDGDRERADCAEEDSGTCTGCPQERWGDGRCDAVCNKEECKFDLGDCAGCNSACPLSWKGDGVCDQECNTAGACDFDGGDCEAVSCNQKADPRAVPCKRSFIGDGRCDLMCNVTACDFDKGDCGAQCAPGCKKEMIGNGFCDDECRAIGLDGKPLCTTPGKPDKFDGGDCLSCAPGCVDSWIGDGSCDDACRVESCKNDMLDCTGCPCQAEVLGDGKCDSPCNLELCMYDLGDCPKPIKDRVIDVLQGLEPWQIGAAAGGTICVVLLIVVVAVVCVYRRMKRKTLKAFDMPEVIVPNDGGTLTLDATTADILPKFRCEICGKEYEVESDVGIHMRARHADSIMRDSSTASRTTQDYVVA